MTVEEFYSNEPTDIWLKILYKNHYHFGYNGDNNIFENAVRNIYPFIRGKDILDCGCGWGGTSQMLIDELNAIVTSVTFSRKQYEYIKNFLPNSVLSDLHDFIPLKKYDLAIFLESFLHLTAPKMILKNFSKNVDSIYINEMYSLKDTFFCNEWKGYFRSKEDYINIFNDSDFKIQMLEDCSDYVAKRESLNFWIQALSNIPRKEKTGQILTLEKMAIQETVSPSSITGFIKIFATRK